MWFIIVSLVFIRLLMYPLYPQIGISHFSDIVFGTGCLTAFVLYGFVKIKTAFSAPLILFVVATAVTTILHGCTDLDVKNLLILDIYLLLVLFIIQIKYNRQIQWLLGCLIGYALLSSVVGVWQIVILHVHRASGLQGWPLSLAGHLLLFMPWALSRLTIRSGIICAGFVSALSVLPAVSLVLLYIRNRWVLLISLCLLAPAVYFKNILGSFNTRIDYYQRALEYLTQSPILGVGTGKYIYSQGSPSLYVHNSYLQIWIEQGFLGFIAIAWLVGLVFYRPISRHRWVWLGLCAFLIDNLFSYTLLKANTSFIFWVMLAIYIRQHTKDNPLSYDKRLSQASVGLE